MSKQKEAASHIRGLLVSRGINLTPRNLTLEDNQKWIIFDNQGQQIGIDAAAGIWKRTSIQSD